MARLRRLYVPGCSHHVIQRGNNRTACFFCHHDYVFYLRELRASAQQFDVAVHAFVLMTNHVHLLVTPQAAESCGRMMQSLGRKYVRYVNKVHRRTGTLWEGRYKSTVVDTERYFLTVSRYIELNPVRAGMVASAHEYSWSSYGANATGQQIDLITPHTVYLGLGTTRTQRAESYRALFGQEIDKKALQDIRQCTNTAWVLGSENFKDRIRDAANRRIESSGWGGDRRSRSLTP